METIGHAIRRERERVGMTLDVLAKGIGVSKSHMSLIESGKRGVTEERVGQIETQLDVETSSLVEILHWQNTPPPLREQLTRLNEREQTSRALADKLRAVARQRRPGKRGTQVLDDLMQSGELRKWVLEHTDNVDDIMPVGRRIPVINSVAAGYPVEFTDLDYPASIADDYIDCPDVTDPQAFAARVIGDSMAPDYREGEIVVFSPAQPTPPGSDCFIRLERDNHTTFKRVYFEDDGHTIRLQPINPAYPPTTIDREEVTGLYVAVYVMRRANA